MKQEVLEKLIVLEIFSGIGAPRQALKNQDRYIEYED